MYLFDVPDQVFPGAIDFDIDVDATGNPSKPSVWYPRGLIEIDCKEMTVDQQLALASAISDGLAGNGVALAKDSKIAIDPMSGKVSADQVAALVRSYISKQKDAPLYSLETDGDKMAVHTPDPLARSRGRQHAGLPDNLYQCPFCGFVTPFEEVYVVHYRAHGFV